MTAKQARLHTRNQKCLTLAAGGRDRFIKGVKLDMQDVSINQSWEVSVIRWIIENELRNQKFENFFLPWRKPEWNVPASWPNGLLVNLGATREPMVDFYSGARPANHGRIGKIRPLDEEAAILCVCVSAF